MSSQLYCTCNRPNTRQTAFARVNGFNCPDCNRTLNPDPNAETYQENNSNQEEPSSPTPNFFPPSPLLEVFPIPPPEEEDNNQHNSWEQDQEAPPAVRSEGREELDTQQNQDEVRWPSPPQNQNPSPYQARTPIRIIDVDPCEIVSDDNDPQDEEAD